MDAVDLLYLPILIRLGIRVAHPLIEECQALGFPEAARVDVQSCVFSFVRSSVELFAGDVLQNWFNLHIATYYTQEISFEIS